MFLLQSSGAAVGVIEKVAVQLLLFCGEGRERRQCGVLLQRPVFPVCEQGSPVHEQRIRVGEPLAEPVEDGEAVSVDVPPPGTERRSTMGSSARSRPLSPVRDPSEELGRHDGSWPMSRHDAVISASER